MKLTTYIVYFSDSTNKSEFVKVWAVNTIQASILAQAERIKGGYDYTVFSIERRE